LAVRPRRPGFGSGDSLLGSGRDNRSKRVRYPKGRYAGFSRVDSMRFPWRKIKDGESSRARPPQSLHILSEYILHMSVTCLGDQDVTPLYEEYILDSRLGDAEKAELTAIYRSLHSVPSFLVPG